MNLPTSFLKNFKTLHYILTNKNKFISIFLFFLYIKLIKKCNFVRKWSSALLSQGFPALHFEKKNVRFCKVFGSSLTLPRVSGFFQKCKVFRKNAIFCQILTIFCHFSPIFTKILEFHPHSIGQIDIKIDSFASKFPFYYTHFPSFLV